MLKGTGIITKITFKPTTTTIKKKTVTTIITTLQVELDKTISLEIIDKPIENNIWVKDKTSLAPLEKNKDLNFDNALLSSVIALFEKKAKLDFEVNIDSSSTCTLTSLSYANGK